MNIDRMNESNPSMLTKKLILNETKKKEVRFV